MRITRNSREGSCKPHKSVNCKARKYKDVVTNFWNQQYNCNVFYESDCETRPKEGQDAVAKCNLIINGKIENEMLALEQVVKGAQEREKGNTPCIEMSKEK